MRSSRNEITMSELASKKMLAAHGLPVNLEREVASADEAAAAAESIGFPVVAKLCGDAIAHKTERGLVRLGLTDADAVRTAAEELLSAAAPDDGPVSVLIGEMVKASRELIVGVNVQPPFGPVVMVGFGGILAEAIEDVSFRLLPVEPIDVEDMLDDLTNQKMLGEFRGEPAIDRVAVAEAVAAVGRAAGAIEGLVSIDVNPMLIRDGTPVAVDALIVTAQS